MHCNASTRIALLRGLATKAAKTSVGIFINICIDISNSLFSFLFCRGDTSQDTDTWNFLSEDSRIQGAAYIASQRLDMVFFGDFRTRRSQGNST